MQSNPVIHGTGVADGGWNCQGFSHGGVRVRHATGAASLKRFLHGSLASGERSREIWVRGQTRGQIYSGELCKFRSRFAATLARVSASPETRKAKVTMPIQRRQWRTSGIVFQGVASHRVTTKISARPCWSSLRDVVPRSCASRVREQGGWFTLESWYSLETRGEIADDSYTYVRENVKKRAAHALSFLPRFIIVLLLFYPR